VTAPSPPVKIFIGTEPRQWIAEAVLRFSIERHASVATEIVSMDYTRGGIWGGWDIGRRRGARPKVRAREDGRAVWFTDFTNYRWAIPEASGFKGRAIYMDVDQLVIGDVRELWELPMAAPILSLTPGETSVMLFDCERMGQLQGWPTVAQMKDLGWGLRQYIKLLDGMGAFAALPPEWNCLDGLGFSVTGSRLIHYTNMATQPWRPYPEQIHYRPHRDPDIEALWFYYASMARDAGRFPVSAWHEASTRQAQALASEDGQEAPPVQESSARVGGRQ
jgi:hypothetical protein